MFDTLLTRGVEPVRWLIALGIAFTLATTALSFFQAPVTDLSATNPARPAGNSAPARPSTNVNWVLSKHLFGEAGAAPVAAKATGPEVATRLPLELQGVSVADINEESSAIIAQKGKSGLLYRVGDTIPGNATLIEVYADRVVMRRAGAREVLKFPQQKLTLAAADNRNGQRPAARHLRPAQNTPARPAATRPVQAAAATPASTAEDTESVVEEYTQRLADDAEGTLDELGLAAADGGGYVLGSNAQSPYLKRTGLQPGDRIMSVNGRPVGDIQSDRLELQNVLAQGSARIEVVRGSRRFFVTVAINN